MPSTVKFNVFGACSGLRFCAGESYESGERGIDGVGNWGVGKGWDSGLEDVWGSGGE